MIPLIVAVIFAIVFLILFAVAASQKTSVQQNARAEFGVVVNTDSNALEQCGTSKSLPCTFQKASISDCEDECNLLNAICTAFTYNAQTQEMKIVGTPTFSSPGVNLFLRQNVE